MITLKYDKKGALAYVSHIDLLRHMERTLRRADLPVRYSQGFNPHMLVNLGITLPLGVASLCEYVTVDVDCTPEVFLERYNGACPEGLVGSACWQVEKNPNLAGVVVAADYRFEGDLGDRAPLVGALAGRAQYEIDYPTKKDAEARKDVAPLLYALKADPCGVDVCMAAGNITVRPQLLADAIAAEFGVTFATGGITRRCQYVRTPEGALLEVDAWLDALSSARAHV